MPRQYALQWGWLIIRDLNVTSNSIDSYSECVRTDAGLSIPIKARVARPKAMIFGVGGAISLSADIHPGVVNCNSVQGKARKKSNQSRKREKARFNVLMVSDVRVVINVR